MGNSSMNTQKLSINQACKRQVVEKLHDHLVNILIVFRKAWDKEKIYIPSWS